MSLHISTVHSSRRHPQTKVTVHEIETMIAGTGEASSWLEVGTQDGQGVTLFVPLALARQLADTFAEYARETAKAREDEARTLK